MILIWRLEDSRSPDGLAYEWVSIQAPHDGDWWAMALLLGIFSPSPASRGRFSVADVNMTYINDDVTHKGLLPPPPAALLRTGGRIFAARCFDWFLETYKPSAQVDVRRVRSRPRRGLAAQTTFPPPARIRVRKQDVERQVAAAHGLERCTITSRGMTALYLAMLACISLGRRPLDNKGIFYMSEDLCKHMGACPEGSVLVWDFGAFGSGERQIPDRVDTVLLDVTLLGPTISTHLTKLAARLHARGIDLVVWSSLSKLTQGGKNSGGGGFVAHIPGGSKELEDAFYREVKRHDALVRRGDLSVDLPHLFVHKSASSDIAARWLSNHYMWARLSELKVPFLQPLRCNTPLFVVFLFPVPSAKVMNDDYHFVLVRSLEPEVRMRNSFGFNMPVFNTYTTHGGGCNGIVRVSVPAMSAAGVDKVCEKVARAVEKLSIIINFQFNK